MGVFVRNVTFFVVRSAENFEFLMCGMGVGQVNFGCGMGNFSAVGSFVGQEIPQLWDRRFPIEAKQKPGQMFCVPTHFETTVQKSVAKKSVITRTFGQTSTKYAECSHTSRKLNTNNNVERGA